MKLIRLLALVLVCAVSLAKAGPAQAALGGGYATNIINGVCYWTCYSGSSGSAPITPGTTCLKLCSWACNGPCIALY